jgi:hypothetical protein
MSFYDLTLESDDSIEMHGTTRKKVKIDPSVVTTGITGMIQTKTEKAEVICLIDSPLEKRPKSRLIMVECQNIGNVDNGHLSITARSSPVLVHTDFQRKVSSASNDTIKNNKNSSIAKFLNTLYSTGAERKEKLLSKGEKRMMESYLSKLSKVIKEVRENESDLNGLSYMNFERAIPSINSTIGERLIELNFITTKP